MTETETFICNIRRYCSKVRMDPVAFLAVRLFETGGTLSARYLSNLNALGILQWTPNGIEPLRIKKLIPGSTNTDAYAQLLKRPQNRLKQLEWCFVYHDYWLQARKNDPIVSKRRLAQLAVNSVEFAYQITLYPGAPSANYTSGKNPTISQLINSANFKAYLQQAKGMLEGTVGVPNHKDGLPLSGAQHAAYVKEVGTSLVKPSTCDITAPLNYGVVDNTNPIPATASEPAKPDLATLYPMECQLKIPEFPRLVGLRAGDTIVLANGQFKDWLVTSVQRTFEQGINQLQITARRPLDPAPFIDVPLNPPEGSDWPKYYWLTNN